MANFSGQKITDRDAAFWSKVDKKKDWECWPWLASTNKDRYGQFWIGNTFTGAHRYAWEVTRKCKVPEGKEILHFCDNPTCCNPNHLYAGTQLQNMKDRHERGSRIPAYIIANPNLHEGEIWLIRRLRVVKSKGVRVRYKFSESLAAKMFRVHQTTIHHIWASDRWLSKEGTYV